MCPPPYISSSGSLVRDGRKRYEFSRPRLAFAAALITTLLVTNPANRLLQDWRLPLPSRGSNEEPLYSSLSSSSWLHQSASTLLDGVLSSLQSTMDGPRRQTNYWLFSLRNDAYDGIYLQTLSMDVPLCRYDGDRGLLDPACGWIEDTFCHGLVFDVRSNRPFAAHRMLEALLLASALLAWCLKPGWWPTEPCSKRPLATLASILWFPSILEDLVSCNLLVYPALQIMDRILSTSASNNNVATNRFYLSAFGLIFGIGGLSNWIATIMSKRGNFGLHGSIAASLGYLMSCQPNKLLMRYFGIICNMTASDILLAVTAIGLIDALLGVQLPMMGRIGRHNVMAWMVGGVLGNLMGQFQVENYTAWWNPIRY